MIRFALLIAALCAGCASTSGVLPTAPGHFTITTQASPGKGGAPIAKRMAYQEAQAECTRQQRQLHVLEETASAPTWTDGMYSATLAFECT